MAIREEKLLNGKSQGNFGLQEILGEYWLPLVLSIIGLCLLIFGLALVIVKFTGEPEIQIISSPEQAPATTEKIIVDIEGSVEKPGVYEMPGGARLNDLLIKAGGLAAAADRQWVRENLNLAMKLADGTKIYIPSRGEVGRFGGPAGQSGGGAGSSVFLERQVNINTASFDELDKLPGIGAVRAEAIIRGRPYSSIEELVDRKIIPQSVFEKVKDKIAIY